VYRACPRRSSVNSGATSRHLLRRREARRIVRAPGSPAFLSLSLSLSLSFSTQGPRLGESCAVLELGASCAPGSPAPTLGPRLGTYCADVRLGASCVPREVQRQLGGHVSAPRTPTWGSAHRACSGKSSVSLSLSLSLNAGPTSRRIVRRRELSAPFVPRKAQRQLGAHASIGQRLRAALLKYITDEELFLKFRDYCRRSIPRPRSVHRSLLNVTSRASTPRAHTGSVLR